MLPLSNKGGGIRLLLFVQLLLQAYARHIGIINTIIIKITKISHTER